MRSSLEQMERVADYLSGNLSPEELSAFESEIAGDPVLREQVEFQQDMTRIVQRRAYRNEINLVARQYGGGHSWLSWKMALVAGAVAVAGVFGYMAYSANGPSENPVAEHIAPEQPETEKEQPSADTSAPSQSEAPAEQHVLASMNRFLANREYHALPPFMGELPPVYEEKADVAVTAPNGKTFLQPVAFNDLDFTPKGFYEELKETLAAEKIASVSLKEAYDYYYRMGGKVWKHTTIRDSIIVERWFKAEEPNALATAGGTHLRRKRNTTYGIIVDGKGDRMKNVTVEYMFYGEKRTVKTDENGVFLFKLYGKIKTDIRLFIPNVGHVTVPGVEFEPKKENAFQVKLPAIKEGPVQDKTGALIHYGVRGSESSVPEECFISPASVRAIREWFFSETFLATKEFEKRLKALHQMKNGQELLEIYVNNVTRDLSEADRLVAAQLSGKDKAVFEAFSDENLGNTSAVSANRARKISQDEYSGKYAYYKTTFQQEIDKEAERQSPKEMEISEHMLQFIAACNKK